MDTPYNLDELIAQVSTLQRVRDENKLLHKGLESMQRIILSQKEALERYTAAWNSITVMGQVSKSTPNTFTITQGELSFTIAANGHPCNEGDWIMVVGTLTREKGHDEPDTLNITAHNIVGIATIAPGGNEPSNGIPAALGSVLG